MSLRIGAQNLASTAALRKTTDNRADDQKALAKQSRGQETTRTADDAAGLAVSDKMGELLKGLEQNLADVVAGHAPADPAADAAPTDSDQLQRLGELATGALNAFAAQTRILPPDAARDSAQQTAGQIQDRSGQAVLGQGTMTTSSVLNLLQ